MHSWNLGLITSTLRNRPQDLRIHDLIAKVAHVRLKDTLRVLLALRAVSMEYEMALESIIGGKYCALKPTTEEAIQCQRAYTWMYESPEISRLLFEIEQLK